MKAFNKTYLPLIAILLCFAVPMSAQQQEADQEKKVIIITKTTDENGEKVIQKIIKEGAEADQYLEGNSIIHIDGEHEGGDHHFSIDVEENEGYKKIRIKGIDENGESFEMDWEGEGDIPADIQRKMNPMGAAEHCTPGKKIIKKRHYGPPSGDDNGFLGVMPGKTVESIDGVETIKGESDLGVVVNDVVEGSAAEAAGLQAEDILQSINGQTVKTVDELTRTIRDHQAGDQIKIGLLRAGAKMEVEATLKARQHRTKGAHAYYWNNEDDLQDFRSPPCKPFIGVYLNLSDDQPEGIAVRRIIPNTPAEEVNLQVGDIITAIDQVEVTSHGALIVERDKHQAGDEFSLTYLRDGVSQTVNATFPACDPSAERPMEGTKIIIIEKEGNIQPDNDPAKNAVEPFAVPESTLSLNTFRTFPNPTDGLVTLRFAAAAEPTIVSVTDITGREIFREDLNTFDGNYNNQIDLSDATEGTLLLTIRQNDQAFTDKIILRKRN